MSGMFCCSSCLFWFKLCDCFVKATAHKSHSLWGKSAHRCSKSHRIDYIMLCFETSLRCTSPVCFTFTSQWKYCVEASSHDLIWNYSSSYPVIGSVQSFSHQCLMHQMHFRPGNVPREVLEKSWEFFEIMIVLYKSSLQPEKRKHQRYFHILTICSRINSANLTVTVERRRCLLVQLPMLLMFAQSGASD